MRTLELRSLLLMLTLMAHAFVARPGFADEPNAAGAKPGTAQPIRVLVMVGPSNHPPGTHEVAAGARLIAYCLENAPGMHFEVEVVSEWPQDEKKLRGISTVVFSGDGFPLAKMKNQKQNMESLAAMMDRGCGIVCYHYATGLGKGQVPEDGTHPLLKWMGGYFAAHCAHHQSVAKIFKEATITPKAKEHPILRGVGPFTVHDEPYINNYFGPKGMASHVTPLASSMLPPDAPKEEVVAWAVERPDGGRGMAIVMPHFFKNWQVDDLRKFVLNGVVWTAKQKIPKQGVEVTLPALETFQPDSVEPKKRKKK